MVATLVSGESHVYYDVVVSDPFTKGVPTGTVGEVRARKPTTVAAIEPAVQDKVTKYKPSPAPAPQISQVQLYTVAFDTLGRWSKDAVSQLREAARRRLSQLDARRCVTRTAMHSRILQRWRAEGSIAPQRCTFGFWHDCVGQSLAGCDAEPIQGGALVNLLLCWEARCRVPCLHFF